MCFVSGLLSAGKSDRSANTGVLGMERRTMLLCFSRTEQRVLQCTSISGEIGAQKQAVLIPRIEFNGFCLSLMFKEKGGYLEDVPGSCVQSSFSGIIVQL